MRYLVNFLVSVVLGAVTTLALVAFCSKMWAWFLAGQYGAGPSYAAWFGIDSIASVGLNLALMSKASEDRSKDKWDDVLARHGAVLLAIAVMLGWTYLVGSVFGWVA